MLWLILCGKHPYGLSPEEEGAWCRLFFAFGVIVGVSLVFGTGVFVGILFRFGVRG
jgi:hypothetical protein